MRIAFYAPMKPPTHPVPSGDRRMGRLLMRALRAAGHQVDLASQVRAWEGTGVGAAQNAIRDRARHAADRLLRRWRDTSPSEAPELWFTYHLYHKAPDWIGPRVATGLGIPYVVAEASYAAKQQGGPWDEGLSASVAAIRQAQAVFTFTDPDAQGLARIVDPASRIVRLSPFLDTGLYARAARQRSTTRRTLGIDPEETMLMAVGMMRAGDKEKSYRVLADALAGLMDRPWRLLLVGFGPLAETIQSWFPDQRVIPVGQVSEGRLATLYGAADLMVWPAVNEAYGMAILEAQAAGLPAVAGGAGGVPEIVADGRTGRIVPVGDAVAFRGAVAELLDDPARRRRLGDAAAIRARARFGLKAAARAIDTVLDRLVA